jgi:small GTP-binding protein
MGGIFSWLKDRFFTKPSKVVMIGLDGAGKTTILMQMKLGEHTQTIPTIGFNLEELRIGKVKMQVWDLGGQDKVRILWERYLKEVDGIVFVVDSMDRDRFQPEQGPSVKREFELFMQNENCQDALVMIMANKQDMEEIAATPEEIGEILELEKYKEMRKNKIKIFGCSAANPPQGLINAFLWFSRNL